MSSNTILEVKDIRKSYPGLDTLEDISISLEKNRFVSILGPSGCGKSTLFNIISGLEQPDRGRVIIDGEEYNGKTGTSQLYASEGPSASMEKYTG